MPRHLKYTPLLLWITCLAACSAVPRSQATAALPTSDPLFASQGGGEPRTAGYWLVWNSCAPDNQADLAAANGGREAGWIILDDLLEDPGVLVGKLEVDSCQAGVNLLQAQDLDGQQRGADLAYRLAAQLLAAQLNLAAGADSCPAAEEAVLAAQLLLVSQGFDGRASHFSPLESSHQSQAVDDLIDQLAGYNLGLLCE